MKKFIVVCLLCAGFSANAQQSPTQFTQCQLNVNEILTMQSFDIDEPISEDARNIFFELYEELNLIYQEDSNSADLPGYVADFNETLNQAAAINLNVSMFQADIDYVNSLNI